MVTVKLEKECGCFRDARNIEATKTFEEKDAAMLYAKGMCRSINSAFCGKHFFSPADTGEDEVTIKVIAR